MRCFWSYNIPHVSNICFYGHNTAHRKQEGPGLSPVISPSFVVKKMGLVSDVFDKDRLTYLRGNTGIGHVRYPNGQW